MLVVCAVSAGGSDSMSHRRTGRRILPCSHHG